MELVPELPVDQAARQNPVQTMEKCLPPVGRDLADCPRCRRPGTSRCPSDGLPHSSTPDEAELAPEMKIAAIATVRNQVIRKSPIRDHEDANFGRELRGPAASPRATSK